MQMIKSLNIFDTAFGGYGVGKDNTGKVILTPYTVEGDVVDVEIVDDKKNFAYAKLIDIKEASTKRASKIVCRKYMQCGGCLFMGIELEYQQEIKKKIFCNALRKYQGALPDISIEVSPQTEYRLRCSLQVREGKLGYYKFKSREFVEIDCCPILMPPLFAKAQKFAELYKFSGEMYLIETDSGVALASIKTDIEMNITDILDFTGVDINGKVFGLGKVNYNTAFGAVGVGCKTFFQSNRFLIDEFQKYAVSLVDEHLSTVELYAGSGFFTAGLSRYKSFIEGVESSKEQVALAKLNGYNVVKADAERYLFSHRNSKDIEQIFIDPPRDGVSKPVLESIKSIKPISIIYVSCNPITLARDITLLSDIYHVDSVKFFDNYPNTHHLEVVTKLTLNR